MIYTQNARFLLKMLNGIMCVYKPMDVTLMQVCSTIKTKLSAELSELEDRPQIQNVVIKGDHNKALQVEVQATFSNSELVLGPRFHQDDIKCSPVLPLGRSSSGVALLSINNGTIASFIGKHNRTRGFRVKGQFGLASDTYYKDGKFVEKSTYRHIKQAHLDRVLASIQANHQKKKYELWGVDMQSQEAYELAVSDYIKPEVTEIPLIYGIKCIEFNLPNFTLEIHSINEYEKYLHTLIHDIGIQMKSTAYCTGVQCIRHSFFTVEHALLKKHWSLQHVLDNIKQNNNLYSENLQKSNPELFYKYKNKCLSL